MDCQNVLATTLKLGEGNGPVIDYDYIGTLLYTGCHAASAAADVDDDELQNHILFFLCGQ